MEHIFSRLKRLNRKKGFTMVEIIIVLVIIAILAAALIPQMIGFVEDAREKTALAEARVVYVAAQAVSTEYYALNGSAPTTLATSSTRLSNASAPEVVKFNSLVTDLTGTIGDIAINSTTGKVTSVKYKGANNKDVTLTPNDVSSSEDDDET